MTIAFHLGISIGAWRVVLPENLWDMSNKQKYELKVKNILFFFKFYNKS